MTIRGTTTAVLTVNATVKIFQKLFIAVLPAHTIDRAGKFVEQNLLIARVNMAFAGHALNLLVSTLKL